uniref:major facilitator superfamily domain-containing protein 8-like n=1 Tax=Styela clava TaxID=7725 RepID=UPI00193A083E|nr:major facilitator superfamily domain-containing protein 8-like [Styela clava]
MDIKTCSRHWIWGIIINLGMLSRATTPEERTGAFSLLMAMRQIGLLIGPGFNVFLNSLNFTLGPFMLNQFTSPGLFMVGIWFIHTVLMFILFKDIEANPDALVQTNAAPKDQATDHSVQGENGLRQRLRSISISTAQAKTFFNEFIREEVIVCLSATFMIMFSQTGIEAAVTPMTLLLFDWGGLFNSYMFCGAGFVVIVSYVSLSFLSKRFSDRSLLIAGCFGTIITYSVLLGYILSLYLQNNVENPAWLLPMFIIDTILLTISLPFLWVPQASLFSKVTSIETQAFNQGIRLAAMGCGQILGPIWASVMATESRLPIMAGVDLLMVLLVTGMVIMSYKKLVVPIEPSHSQPKPSLLSQPDSESSPLLSASINA